MSVTSRDGVAKVPPGRDGFVGRGPELDRICTLLSGSARLITLIGSGGIGKTRLASEAVDRFRKASGTPIHWVRLARLATGSDVGSVEEEVAQSVIEADFSGRSAWKALVDTFTDADGSDRDPQHVLVMDNCEHVLDGAGRLVADLLEAVPTLTVIATSREAVGWVDEQLVLVPPLSQDQALRLFRQRAGLVDETITTADQIATADRICRHVHNHPLYIRLAAARLRYQPLVMILQDLSGEATDKRMRWTHGPRVGAERRHQGVGDVIAWSYDLCRDKERLLLERLAVFAAGYDTNPEDDSDAAVEVGADLEAIEVVCADDGLPDDPSVALLRDEIEGLLERLVDQSLVTAHRSTTTVRYSLLESIRLFAMQRLRLRSTGDVDEPERLARRHRCYYRDKILRAQFSWFGPAERELLDWARAAWDNILVAIDTSLAAPGESVLGLEISMGLIALRAPFFKGSVREVRRWTEHTLAATRTLTVQPTDLQTIAVALIAWIALCQGKHEDAERMLEECVAACLPESEARQQWRRDPDTDIGLLAPVEYAWGVELLMVRRDPKAITVLARAREKIEAFGDRGGAAMCSLFEAMAAGFLGTRRQALDISRRHLDHVTESGARWAQSWAELTRAVALTKHGDPSEALTIGHTALQYLLATRDQWGMTLAVHIRTWSLAKLTADLIETGSPDRSRLRALAVETAQLLGGGKTLRESLGIDIDELAPFLDETNKATDIARRVLGDEGFLDAERAGSLLRVELNEVQRLALGALSIERMAADHPARNHASSPWSELSAAEQEVALLAAAGWTNTAIAARRGNSFKTVNAQMTAIFQKLAITARGDIIRFVPEDRTARVDTEAARRPRRGGNTSPGGRPSR